jgi:hypothetical protein
MYLVACLITASFVIFTSAFAESETNPRMGPLGYALGTPLTVEGTHPAQLLSSNSWSGFRLDVYKVNEKQLAKPIRILLYNVNDMSKFELSSNTVYRLRGKEWLTKGFWFVISEVISPPGYAVSVYGNVKKSEDSTPANAASPRR